MKLVIFGAPGVGKGTQAKILSEKLKIVHISTGDILRQVIKQDSETGRNIKNIIDKGQLVPDEIMIEIVKEAITSENCSNGYILDGFPRTVNQAVMLDRLFISTGQSMPIIIDIAADDEVLISRLTSRRTCNSCKNIVSLSDIKEKDVCPICNSVNTLEKRKDDDEDVIRKRLKVFHETTAPVMEYYSKKGNIIKVNGIQPIEKVNADILEELH